MGTGRAEPSAGAATRRRAARGADGGGRPHGGDPGGLSALAAVGGGADPARGVRGGGTGPAWGGVAAGGPTLILLRAFGVSVAEEGAGGVGSVRENLSLPPAYGRTEQLGVVEGSENWVSGVAGNAAGMEDSRGS